MFQLIVVAVIVLAFAITISLVDIPIAKAQQSGAIMKAQDTTISGTAFIFFNSKQLFGWASSCLKDNSDSACGMMMGFTSATAERLVNDGKICPPPKMDPKGVMFAVMAFMAADPQHVIGANGQPYSARSVAATALQTAWPCAN